MFDGYIRLNDGCLFNATTRPMSDQLERAVTTISVANEVTNYPVPLGELAELHSMNRLPSVLFLRFLSVEQVDGEEVTVCVGHQDVDPTTDQPDSGLRLVVRVM